MNLIETGIEKEISKFITYKQDKKTYEPTKRDTDI